MSEFYRTNPEINTQDIADWRVLMRLNLVSLNQAEPFSDDDLQEVLFNIQPNYSPMAAHNVRSMAISLRVNRRTQIDSVTIACHEVLTAFDTGDHYPFIAATYTDQIYDIRRAARSKIHLERHDVTRYAKKVEQRVFSLKQEE